MIAGFAKDGNGRRVKEGKEQRKKKPNKYNMAVQNNSV